MDLGGRDYWVMTNGRRGGWREATVDLRVRGWKNTTSREEGGVRRNDNGPGQRVASERRTDEGDEVWTRRDTTIDLRAKSRRPRPARKGKEVWEVTGNDPQANGRLSPAWA